MATLLYLPTYQHAGTPEAITIPAVPGGPPAEEGTPRDREARVSPESVMSNEAQIAHTMRHARCLAVLSSHWVVLRACVVLS